MIPALSLRGMAVMGGLALLLILPFLPSTAGAGPGTASHPRRLGLDAQMFFLGAGFMLIETKAVVQMALLFGSTWMVNSVVFFAVLVMILVANLFVLASATPRGSPLLRRVARGVGRERARAARRVSSG